MNNINNASVSVPSTPKPPAGHIEVITTSVVSGWINRDGGGVNAVELLHNGKVVDVNHVFEDRPDVATVGIIQKQCGWKLSLPPSTQIHPNDQISIRVRGATTAILDCFIHEDLIKNSLRWHIDNADASKILGWVAFGFDPAKRVLLQVTINGSLATEVMANNFRHDLKKAGIGDGYHAFELRLDPWRLDNDESLDVVVTEPITGTILYQCRMHPFISVDGLLDCVQSGLINCLVPPVWAGDVWRSTFASPSAFDSKHIELNPCIPLPGSVHHILSRHVQDGRLGTVDEILSSLMRGADLVRNHIGGEIRFSDELLAAANHKVVIFSQKISAVPRMLLVYKTQYRNALDWEKDINSLVYDFIVDVVLRWKLDHRVLTRELWTMMLVNKPLDSDPSVSIPFIFSILHDNSDPVKESLSKIEPENRGRLLVLLGSVLFAPAAIHKYLSFRSRDVFLKLFDKIRESGAWADLCRMLNWPVNSLVWDASIGSVKEALPAVPVVTKDLPSVRIFTNDTPGTGLGQNVEYTIKALKRIDVRCELFYVNDRVDLLKSSDRLSEGNWVNLFHVQPDNLPMVISGLPNSIWANSRNIGFFMWELHQLANAHLLGINLVDEIWTATTFTESIFKNATSIPVIKVGHAVEPIQPSARNFKDELGLSDKFTFFFSFDANSGLGRKNPIGTVAAFIKAFGNHPNHVHMLIKSTGISRLKGNVHVDTLLDIVSNCEAISVLDLRLGARDYSALINQMDCYISLHRSEGFGYTAAEAMYFGCPVIATGYSGSDDFCTSETAALVKYQLSYLRKHDFIYEVPGSSWAEPDINHAADQMKMIVGDRAKAGKMAAVAKKNILTNFSIACLAKRYQSRLAEIASELCSGKLH